MTQAESGISTGAMEDTSSTASSEFVNSTYSVFDRLQQSLKELEGRPRKQTPRSQPAATIATLLTAAISSYSTALITPLPDNTHSSQILSLASLLLIQTPPQQILPSLQKWYKQTATLTQSQVDQITSSPTPHLHPLYWQTVVKCISLDTSLYTRLLNLHPSTAETDTLIALAPLSSPSKREFMDWHRRVKYTTFTSTSNTPTPTDHILSILKGDQISLAHYISPNAFLTNIFTAATVSNPLLRAHELSDLLSAYPVDTLEADEKIVHTILRLDAGEAITSAANYDAWLAFHLADLFMHAQIFDSSTDMPAIAGPNLDSLHQTTFKDIRDYLLTVYADSLHTQKHTLTAIKYLLYLPKKMSHSLITKIVHEMPLASLHTSNTESQTHTLISLLKRNALFSVIKSIYSILARRAFEAGEWREALLMHLYSGDEVNVDMVVEKIVEGFFIGEVGRVEMNTICNQVGGDACELEMYESTDKSKSGAALVIQNVKSIQFLFQFTRYRDLLNKDDIKEAGAVLGGIVEGRLTPQRFDFAVLEEVVAMCAGERVGLGVGATYESMRLLDYVEVCVRESESKQVVFRHGVAVDVSKMEKGEVEGLFEVVRRALVENLARAYIDNLE